MAQGKGIVIVFTGPGKGKTTAALGAALRLLGHGGRVCLVQFVKSRRSRSGEYEAARAFGERFEIHTLGRGFIFDEKDTTPHRQAAREAWHLAQKKMASGRYVLVILDEIAYALTYGYLPITDVLEALRKRPAAGHVCLTGRDMPQEVVEAADLVTVMEEKKHPYHQGRKNIKGIDY
jgi:cob(I)alamin adenosyltransferase